MNRNTLRILFCAFVLLTVSGCVHEISDGSTQTFTYEIWVPLLVFLAGIAATLVGWFLRKTSARFGWGLLILGPVAAIIFAPSLLRDRAVVDDAMFSQRTGIWGLTSVHEVMFEDTQRVSIISEEVSGRRGSKRTNYFLLCEQKNGESIKIPVNNKVSRAAAPYFLDKAAALGIPIVDES